MILNRLKKRNTKGKKEEGNLDLDEINIDNLHEIKEEFEKEREIHKKQGHFHLLYSNERGNQLFDFPYLVRP